MKAVDESYDEVLAMKKTLLLTIFVVLHAASLVSGQGPSRLTTRPRTSATLDAGISGVATKLLGGSPIESVRVTLFKPDLGFFRETRTAVDGSYSIQGVRSGSYRLGFAALGHQYEEFGVLLMFGANIMDATLLPETEVGSWDVIGNTLPEVFDATDIGVLRPDGTVFYCHDTTDPIVFDPRTGAKTFPPPSGSEQGCMNATLLEDGSVLLMGGQAGADPANFVNGIPWVKRFFPDDTWQILPDMNNAAGRWYPGLARLNDGSLLVMGGGQAPNAARTETCELFDLSAQTWSWVGAAGQPFEFPPSALLFNGQVLHSWGGQPQLYDVGVGTWSDTGQFAFPNRGYPGHSDHSLLVLSDGRGLAVGVSRLNQPTAQMTEFYDPASGTWSAGSSPDLVRMQAEVVYLPDGQVLVGAGDKETTGGPEPNVLGIVKRCDLLDPRTGAWRRVADLSYFREYHAVTLLLPDGRVTTTGGTRIKFQFGPTTSDIEAYSPPYLFRGVRPELSALSNATPSRGEWISFGVFPDTRLTSVVLMGLQSTTHWLDAGIPRRIELSVLDQGALRLVALPSDPDLLPLGWYMLFGMVDDIPSEALILRVDP